MQRTYREIIGEIVPGHAIAEAERRVYDINVGTEYACAEGFCALGIMLREIASGEANESHDRFPGPRRFRGAYEDASPTVRRRRIALAAVYRANDRGLLAQPGSLTALLDRPFKAEVR